MPAPEKVIQLVDRFRAERTVFTSSRYNETQVRREFIDPLFTALGWDVDNSAGAPEPRKQVVHEDALRIAGARRAPDYGFRLDGQTRFFVEAKKPSVNLRDDVSPAYQVRAYGWSARLPVSILTDFEEFAYYDCRLEPERPDPAATARLAHFTFEDYAGRWDELVALFSPEAVRAGSLDALVGARKLKKGTLPVDAAFLREIEGWRAELAASIARRNLTLSAREVNLAVQLTIDRIVFLRICEDRGLEAEDNLRRLASGDRVYRRLLDDFRRADQRYNSGLFHLTDERGRPGTDTLTPGLTVDDAPLHALFNRLYTSPYAFSVIPVEILGQVYEQFLGRVITVEADRSVTVDLKPEVRKAGGVYYTPTYIVDYIVRHTVGRLVDGKTPDTVRSVKILDPACGSGSFLLGAYGFLLGWYLDWYAAHSPKTHRKAVFQGDDGAWRLTAAEKRRILLDHLFGVDIDPQAAEVTKLSLLLKMSEGEVAGAQTGLGVERLLPDLDGNIKSGNSLIGPDFYDGQLDLSDETMHRVNAFDWPAEFPAAFKAGGFDAVIGNPPYVLTQSLDEQESNRYFLTHFKTARYKVDTYQLFIEQGIKLLRFGGKMGYITPNTFLRNKYAIELRRLILDQSEVDLLRLFYFSVFQSVSVDTSILVLTRTSSPSGSNQISVVQSNHPTDERIAIQPQNAWLEHSELNFGLPGAAGSGLLLAKFEGSIRLGDFATAYFGIQTFDRKSFVADRLVNDTYKPVIDGTHVNRYRLMPNTEFVHYLPENVKSGGKQIVYEQERIAVRQIGQTPVATLVPAGLYTLNTIYNIFFIRQTEYSIKFILGVLSSRAVSWYWRQCFFDQKQTFPKVKKESLLSVPIPRIEFTKPAEKAKHDRLVGLVDQMLALNERLAGAKLTQDRTILTRQIDATDRQIDRLVYDLYDLTPAEIALVEAAPE